MNKEIPKCELWLYENLKTFKEVYEGLKQAQEGNIRKRGSFSKYAKFPILN